MQSALDSGGIPENKEEYLQSNFASVSNSIIWPNPSSINDGQKKEFLKSNLSGSPLLYPLDAISKIDDLESKASGLLAELSCLIEASNAVSHSIPVSPVTVPAVSQKISETSPNFNIDTNDEFSFLVAAAAGGYFNTLWEQQAESNGQKAFTDHSNNLSAKETNTISNVIKDIESFSRLTSLNVDAIVDVPIGVPKNIQPSECATTVGLDSPTKTNDLSDTATLLFNSSLPISYETSNCLDKLWNTTSGRIYENPCFVGSPIAYKNDSPNKVNVQKNGSCIKSTGIHDAPTSFYSIPLSFHSREGTESYYSEVAFQNKDVNKKTSSRGCAKVPQAVSRHILTKGPVNFPTRLTENSMKVSQSCQQRKPPVQSGSLLCTKNYSGRSFFPPVVLAHPEEFRNPSSFLKVYGDPLCGIETKFSNCEDNIGGGLPKSNLLTIGQNGNWVCSKCQNINYPRRYRCNKCNQIRGASGDLIVSEYALGVYYHHLKAYKELSGNSKDYLTPSSTFQSPAAPTYADQFHKPFLDVTGCNNEFQPPKESIAQQDNGTDFGSTRYVEILQPMASTQESGVEYPHPPSREASIDEIEEIDETNRFHSSFNNFRNSESSWSASTDYTASSFFKHQNQPTASGDVSANSTIGTSRRQVSENYQNHHGKTYNASVTPPTNFNYNDMRSLYKKNLQNDNLNFHPVSSTPNFLDDEYMRSPTQPEFEEFHTPISTIRTAVTNKVLYPQKSQQAVVNNHVTEDVTQGFCSFNNDCSAMRTPASSKVWKDLSNRNNKDINRNRNTLSSEGRFGQIKSSSTSIASSILKETATNRDLKFPNLNEVKN